MQLDMVVLMVLHEEFGFGAERLKRFYRAILPMSNRYAKYNDSHDPDFGRKSKDGRERTDIYKLRKDLYEIGVDYNALIEEMEK